MDPIIVMLFAYCLFCWAFMMGIVSHSAKENELENSVDKAIASMFIAFAPIIVPFMLGVEFARRVY